MDSQISNSLHVCLNDFYTVISLISERDQYFGPCTWTQLCDCLGLETKEGSGKSLLCGNLYIVSILCKCLCKVVYIVLVHISHDQDEYDNGNLITRSR